jgi:hypothetical protein
VSYDVKAVAMNLGGRWWYFPGDSIESILWEVTWREGVPLPPRMHRENGAWHRGRGRDRRETASAGHQGDPSERQLGS